MSNIGSWEEQEDGYIYILLIDPAKYPNWLPSVDYYRKQLKAILDQEEILVTCHEIQIVSEV